MPAFDRIRICGSNACGVPDEFCTRSIARQACNEVRSEFRTFRADVVEIVAVKALWNHSEPQHSIAWLQLIQSTTVIFTRSQQISTGSKIWFGTRGSEVQILSPRPLKSIT